MLSVVLKRSINETKCFYPVSPARITAGMLGAIDHTASPVFSLLQTRLVAPTTQDVPDHTEVGSTSRCMSPGWMKSGNTWLCGFCLYKHQTNTICSHSLGIRGIDLASVHCPGRYLAKLGSNLA